MDAGGSRDGVGHNDVAGVWMDRVTEMVNDELGAAAVGVFQHKNVVRGVRRRSSSRRNLREFSLCRNTGYWRIR